jgi:hypothetical protein
VIKMMESKIDREYEKIKRAIKEVLVEENIGFLSKVAYAKLVNSCKYEISRTRAEYNNEELKQIIRYELGLIVAH